jgi:hypothetical protein
MAHHQLGDSNGMADLMLFETSAMFLETPTIYHSTFT